MTLAFDSSQNDQRCAGNIVSEATIQDCFLPVPSYTCTDIGGLLSSLAFDRSPRIDVLIGPADAGKSALLRRLALEYRCVGDVVRLVDLSFVDWQQGLMNEGRTDVVFVDHIDRITDREHFRMAYGILDRGIPVLFARGLSRLVIAFDKSWRETFNSVYSVDPERLLVNAAGGGVTSVHLIRPYTDPELVQHCDRLRLDMTMFLEPSLRLPGVLSLAAAARGSRPRMTSSHLRDVLARRWMDSANSSCSHRIRRFLWKAMGYLSIRDNSHSFSLLDLSDIVNYSF
ncbi:MAG: hypothetical protein QG608_915, partial [Actinomycetota bacterium]|nr:hypothetical protein [Actinomycetota bacterium]